MLAQGLQVLRFTNEEILNRSDDVIRKIVRISLLRLGEGLGKRILLKDPLNLLPALSQRQREMRSNEGERNTPRANRKEFVLTPAEQVVDESVRLTSTFCKIVSAISDTPYKRILYQKHQIRYSDSRRILWTIRHANY